MLTDEFEVGDKLVAAVGAEAEVIYRWLTGILKIFRHLSDLL